MRRIVVVGGGPAGLAAADVASAAGHAVTLYERMPSLGRKLLMAGRGGLNLTHSEPVGRLLGRFGEARAWLEPMIDAFPPDAVRAFADGLGQPTFVGSSGRVFPAAMKASPLLRAWLGRLASRGVEVHLRHRLVGLGRPRGLVFETPDGMVRDDTADAVVLALGGASWPRLGADGGWVGLLTGLGVGVAPLEASNVGVAIGWSAPVLARHAGSPLKRIAIGCGGETVRGEAVVTRQGLEGGAVYSLGPAVRRQLAGTGAATLVIDLRPDMTREAVAARLARPRGKLSQTEWLRKALRLASVEVALMREAAGRTLPADAEALARLVKAVPLVATGLGGLERAISTAGGVGCGEVDESLMIRSGPGIFVAGEMLDWDAPTGGYLLQAVLATGRRAGEGAVGFVARADVPEGGAARDGEAISPMAHE